MNKRLRNIARKFYILPCCLLVLNVFEEIITYKTEVIRNPYWRTAVLIGLFAFGFFLVGNYIAPWITNILTHMQRESKKKSGHLGEVIFLGALGLILYYIYFKMYIHGVESLLPPEAHNTGRFH